MSMLSIPFKITDADNPAVTALALEPADIETLAIKLRDDFFGPNAEYTDVFLELARDALIDCTLRTAERASVRLKSEIARLVVFRGV